LKGRLSCDPERLFNLSPQYDGAPPTAQAEFAETLSYYMNYIILGILFSIFRVEDEILVKESLNISMGGLMSTISLLIFTKKPFPLNPMWRHWESRKSVALCDSLCPFQIAFQSAL
jgi:hypothetical protein